MAECLFHGPENGMVQGQPSGVLLQTKDLLIDHLHPWVIHGLVVLQQGLLQKPLGVPLGSG